MRFRARLSKENLSILIGIINQMNKLTKIGIIYLCQETMQIISTIK